MPKTVADQMVETLVAWACAASTASSATSTASPTPCDGTAALNGSMSATRR